MEQQQHNQQAKRAQHNNPSWENLMSAAEGVVARFLYAGPSPQRVDGDILELTQRCPGFKDHEYRQAYWQSVQNLRHRTEESFSMDAEALLSLPVDHTAFDAGMRH
jgi:hypothetical protein